MGSAVRVILEDIHFPLMEYYDWLATGLWMLQDDGQIEAEVRTTRTTLPFQTHRKSFAAFRKVLPGVAAALARGTSSLITGRVEAGGKSVSFVFDIGDSPYAFQTDLLLEKDLYFKAQCPASFDPRGFPIARDAWFPYHPDVITYQDRIRPAMLGRPLSRTLNKRQNAQILQRWRDRAKGSKDLNLFAFFGSDKIDWVGGPERIVLERFADRTAHPNPKRGLLVEGLRQRYPAGQGVDARILNTDSAARRGPKLGDDDYPAVVGRAWHNINISGFRRSLPFRFIDSFLVGASVPSDEIALRWYAPFDMTNEVIDLGPMGYELDRSVDWPRVWTVFDGLMSEPPNRRDERRQHIVQRFETLWHPRAFARYVVDQCLQHMG